MATKHDTTQLLLQLVEGDHDCAQMLFSLLYDDLRGRAQLAFRGEHAGHTWQPTALVHEAYLRMIDQRRARWQNRAHFCAVASQVMRRILVDHAREKGAQRRGLGWQRVPLLAESTLLAVDRIEDVLFVDGLIEELTAVDPRQAEIVKLRFFGGLTVPEVAEVMGVSQRTIEGEWTMIRAILRSKVATS
jgi:RNA polymerase sigma-70 factor (ECF subfamily)